MFDICDSCKKVKLGDRDLYEEFIQVPIIKGRIASLSNFMAHKTGIEVSAVRNEVILKLWELIKDDFPTNEEMTDELALQFIFGIRLKGRVLDVLLCEHKDLVKRVVQDKVIYLKKITTVSLDDAHQSISDNLPKILTQNKELVWSILDNAGLKPEENLSLILHWDLDMEPLDRDRGRWSTKDIAKLLGLSEKDAKSVIDSGMEKVRLYAKTKRLEQFYRTGAHY